MDELKELWINEDSWIVREDIPTRPGRKPIKTSDPDYGLSEEEIMNRNEFIRVYLMKAFEPLFLIPAKEPEDDFFTADYADYLDFVEYQTSSSTRSWRSFKRYSYAVRKILERVADLAIMHSAISSLEGKINTMKRYERLIEREFGERLSRIVEWYKHTKDDVTRYRLKRKIGELNRRILEARSIWERLAP